MRLADVHARLFMAPLWVVLGHTCTDVLKPKFVVHHFVGLTMANLQNMCHFINSHSFLYVTARSSGSFVMRNIWATIFFNPFVDTPLLQYTVPVMCRKSLMDCGPWYTFRPLKPDHWTLLFLVHTESGAAMINGNAATMELTYQHQTCVKNDDNKTTHAPPAQHVECCQQKHKYNCIADNYYWLTFILNVIYMLFSNYDL